MTEEKSCSHNTDLLRKKIEKLIEGNLHGTFTYAPGATLLITTISRVIAEFITDDLLDEVQMAHLITQNSCLDTNAAEELAPRLKQQLLSN